MYFGLQHSCTLPKDVDNRSGSLELRRITAGIIMMAKTAEVNQVILSVG